LLLEHPPQDVARAAGVGRAYHQRASREKAETPGEMDFSASRRLHWLR
jgi:hypothetical protein